MTSYSSRDEQLDDAPSDRLRLALTTVAEEVLDQRHVAAGIDQVDLLEQLLGLDLCKRLGVFRIPGDFLLSVVMPVYNEATTIRRIIDRVIETQLPLELILVDDGSTDGTRDVLAQLPEESPVKVVLHERNQGKGAAVRTGLAQAAGDVVVIQDADMEYDPLDFRVLLQPILEGEADVVYGSRFGNYDRPVSPLWHQWANQFITFVTNLATGKKFTDVETCYKMFRRETIADLIPHLRETRFGIEIELTCKLARKPGVSFYERPIRYYRRSYAEGKKIGWKDGVAALWCILRYSVRG